MSATVRLHSLQVDALREVANIAGGNAATALGQLTGRPIMITIPRLTVARVGEIPKLLDYDNQRVVVVALKVLGAFTGTLVFLMPDRRARDLCAMLLGRTVPNGPLDELSRSSLGEVANIIGGAYVGALATMMGGAIMLSVPTIGIEPPDEILAAQRGAGAQSALLIETTLTCDNQAAPLGGHILLLPDDGAPFQILDALRVPESGTPAPAAEAGGGAAWL